MVLSLSVMLALQLTKEDYLALWPNIAPKINQLANNVSNGRGFQIIRYSTSLKLNNSILKHNPIVYRTTEQPSHMSKLSIHAVVGRSVV